MIMENKKIVTEFIKRYVGDNIDEKDDIFSLGLVNSLFAMQLIAFIENQWGISVSNSDLDFDNFKSIESIVSFIDKKSSDKKANF